MKQLNFISKDLLVASSGPMGRGVYARKAIKKNEVIEVSPVIVMSQEERRLLDQTLLHDYIFEWGRNGTQCCMALGYIPLYNHSYDANCEYEMDFRKNTITIKTVRPVAEGEELFINYNGDYNNEKPVWFDALKK